MHNGSKDNLIKQNYNYYVENIIYFVSYDPVITS